MSEQDDRTFMQHFGIVIAALAAFTVIMIILALIMHNRLVPSENPAREAAKIERISPYASVYAGETGRAAARAATEAAAPAEAAFDGSLDGEMIYQQVCQVCHVTGAGDAPLMTPEAWADRIGKGRDELVASVINGLGAMPPKAGRPDLTEEQIEATVEYMLEQVR